MKGRDLNLIFLTLVCLLKLSRKLHIIAAYAIISFLSFTPIVSAAPNGGDIVGGAGTINTSDLTTNIKQFSSSMAIDWTSYNLDSNEIVNYLQPNSSAISLTQFSEAKPLKSMGKSMPMVMSFWSILMVFSLVKMYRSMWAA